MTKGAANPRRQALRVLTEVFEQGAYSNLALKTALQTTESRDAALVKQLVFGTVTYRQSLDYLLGRWLTRPLAALDANVRNILRLGLYQVVYLDTPDHAAVSESVNLARAVSHQGAAGLVNAILRRAARERERLPWPKTDDPVHDLAIRESFPEWMVRRWAERLGQPGAEAFCRAQNQAPAVELRVNSRRSTRPQLLESLAAEGVKARPHPLVQSSVQLAGASLPQLQALSSGECTVQGAASTLVGLVVDPKPGELVYDLCAAPGGKAIHLAELMADEGQVVALDNHAGRLQLITQAAARMQITSVQPLAADARTLGPADWQPADRVLVDAPCSGMGVIRRKPDIRWHRSFADVLELQSLQLEILAAAASVVKPGGILVYSVCSTEPEETEAVVYRFLQQHREFLPADWPKELQAVFPGRVAQGQLTTYPHLDDLDGFFICRLQKTNTASITISRQEGTEHD